ncbi:hypothetical protein TGRUB_430200, partial [Toxoplasma gondii RUB]
KTKKRPSADVSRRLLASRACSYALPRERRDSRCACICWDCCFLFFSDGFSHRYRRQAESGSVKSSSRFETFACASCRAEGGRKCSIHLVDFRSFSSAQSPQRRSLALSLLASPPRDARNLRALSLLSSVPPGKSVEREAEKKKNGKREPSRKNDH